MPYQHSSNEPKEHLGHLVEPSGYEVKMNTPMARAASKMLGRFAFLYLGS